MNNIPEYDPDRSQKVYIGFCLFFLLILIGGLLISCLSSCKSTSNTKTLNKHEWYYDKDDKLAVKH